MIFASVELQSAQGFTDSRFVVSKSDFVFSVHSLMLIFFSRTAASQNGEKTDILRYSISGRRSEEPSTYFWRVSNKDPLEL